MEQVVVGFVRWELHTRRNNKPGDFITRLSVPVPPEGTIYTDNTLRRKGIGLY
jgi:hypothetical protein